MNNVRLIGLTAALALGPVAYADVMYSFDSLTLDAREFDELFGAGTLVGTLTAVQVKATLDQSVRTWASDLTVYFDRPPLGSGAVQVGGYSPFESPVQHYLWSNGNSGAVGTIVSSTVTLATGLVFSGTADDQIVYLGNGFAGAGASGTWSGSITLVGVTEVPAPGAIALLGLAGLAAGRRRRA